MTELSISKKQTLDAIRRMGFHHKLRVYAFGPALLIISFFVAYRLHFSRYALWALAAAGVVNIFFVLAHLLNRKLGEMSLLLSNIPVFLVALLISFIVKDSITICVMVAFILILQSVSGSHKLFIINISFAGIVYGGYELLLPLLHVNPIVLSDTLRMVMNLSMGVVLTALFGILLRREKVLQDGYLKSSVGEAETRKEILDKIQSSLAGIRDVSTTLGNVATTVVDGSEKQEKSLSEISAAIEEISVSSGETRDLTGHTRETSEKAKNNLHENTDQLSAMVNDFDSITEQTSLFSDLLMDLVKSITEMESVLTFNESIGDKIEILSVNAAIEASKAGEAGLGFAVVAQEMQELVSSTEESLGTGHKILHQIRSKSDSSANNLQSVQKKIAEYQKSLSIIRKTIANTARQYAAVSDKVVQIASASEQQRKGMEEITAGIKTVQEFSMELQSVAQHLKSTIDKVERYQSNIDDLIYTTR